MQAGERESHVKNDPADDAGELGDAGVLRPSGSVVLASSKEHDEEDQLARTITPDSCSA